MVRQAFQGGDIFQILLHGEFGVEAEFLGEVSDHVPVGVAELVDRDAVVADAARSGLHDAADHAHQGSLAGTVGAEKSPDAGAKFQADVVYGCLTVLSVFELL